jgi:hypothetical protein
LDLDWIKAMADRHRAEVGFVQRAALAEGIARGEVFVVAGQYVGLVASGCAFVHFHRRRDGWRTVYELCSEVPGCGRTLLAAVPRPVRLKCPVDLPANGFYERVGGTLARTEPGKRRALNVWEWPA